MQVILGLIPKADENNKQCIVPFHKGSTKILTNINSPSSQMHLKYHDETKCI